MSKERDTGMQLIKFFLKWVWAKALVGLYAFLLKILKGGRTPLASEAEQEMQLEGMVPKTTARTVEPPTTSGDDLKIIEGIGPKISSVLQLAGINTFEQLARCQVAQLEQILKDAGIRLANPATWPEQARLAASGDWSGLAELKNQLKGGRKV